MLTPTSTDGFIFLSVFRIFSSICTKRKWKDIKLKSDTIPCRYGIYNKARPKFEREYHNLEDQERLERTLNTKKQNNK